MERSVEPVPAADLHANRMRAGRISLVVGIAIFGAKLCAAILTGSSAVLADAMESTINVASAAMLLLALGFAARPPDRSHPYGHGKIEFLSAGIEGAAIAFAALVIVAESIRELVEGPVVQRIDLGLALIVAATIGNALLGRYLVRAGHASESPALEADGRHVMADVWTSLGVIVGLIVVQSTGWVIADPLIAMAIAVHVAREGYGLLQQAFGGLMDEADEERIRAAVARLDAAREDDWIDLHGLRCWRSGARRHFDLHMMVPRYYDVEGIHSIHDKIEALLLEGDPHGGDVVVHFDPCVPRACSACVVSECPIRSEDFAERRPFTTEGAVRPDPEVALHGGDATVLPTPRTGSDAA